MIRILRLIGPSAMISGRVFDRLFARNLCPEMSLEAVDLAQWLNFIFENGPIEVQDQPNAKACDPEIREHLGDEHVVESFDALDLDDHSLVDNQIRSAFGD